jgi:RNA-binding protein
VLELRQADENSVGREGGNIEKMSGMTAGKKRRIKRRLGAESPTIWVGKSGASQQLLKEIEKQLEKEEMVKAKILQSALAESEAKQLATKISEQTDATLVEVRGHTFILYKRRRK